jgi:hypothetical protein
MRPDCIDRAAKLWSDYLGRDIPRSSVVFLLSLVETTRAVCADCDGQCRATTRLVDSKPPEVDWL